eukprot:CAMPEP_0114132400 /NCGR_PEP_ID=MMETSP0043_2-20121206/13075_1 /TAXON_ID=464988 /ORGANISM="Hemiselmis andersenii, Strain CCMP644" /LENGTH=196 /DNA_ID=CAMNT_0001225913 /DNA_START=128 /DNA_END=718 /DNA_ORIENTATION=+
MLGLMSIVFITDVHHGGISEELFLKFNYPRWLTPAVGTIQFLIASLNGSEYIESYQGPNLAWASQRMVALLMGGCLYTHVRVEKSLADATGPVIFWIFSVAIPVMEGREKLEYVGPAHLALAALGWVIGELISKLQPPPPPRALAFKAAAAAKREQANQRRGRPVARKGGAAQRPPAAATPAAGTGEAAKEAKKDK